MRCWGWDSPLEILEKRINKDRRECGKKVKSVLCDKIDTRKEIGVQRHGKKKGCPCFLLVEKQSTKLNMTCCLPTRIHTHRLPNPMFLPSLGRGILKPGVIILPICGRNGHRWPLSFQNPHGRLHNSGSMVKRKTHLSWQPPFHWVRTGATARLLRDNVSSLCPCTATDQTGSSPRFVG